MDSTLFWSTILSVVIMGALSGSRSERQTASPPWTKRRFAATILKGHPNNSTMMMPPMVSNVLEIA